MMVQMASSNALIQARVPNELRGRVMALYSMMFMGMAPIGALVYGALAARHRWMTTFSLSSYSCRATMVDRPAGFAGWL